MSSESEGGLKKDYFPTNLVDSEKMTDKIIRTETSEELQKRYKGRLETPELIKIAEESFNELEEKYGILVPAHFFVGQDNSANSVVDKIEGKNLVQVESSAEIVPKIQYLYASIAKYYLDKMIQGGYYLPDLNNPNQYVYGRKMAILRTKSILLIRTSMFTTARSGSIPLWSG